MFSTVPRCMGQRPMGNEQRRPEVARPDGPRLPVQCPPKRYSKYCNSNIYLRQFNGRLQYFNSSSTNFQFSVEFHCCLEPPPRRPFWPLLQLRTAACRFVIVSKDAANNLRWNAFGQTVIADDDYTVNVITSLDPPITAIVNKTQNAATTGVFQYEFHQESPSQFYKIVATTKTGASIVNKTGSVEALEVKVGAGAVLASVTKDAVTTYPDTVERYQHRITYTVRYTCPSEGLFRIQLMINSSVTENANCSNYALATHCSNFGCAGQTFGECKRYREYWVQSFATPGTSYARLVRYEARPNNTLLRAGQTTNNAGQPKAPDSGDFFTVELTSVTNPNLKIAITSSSMVQGQGAGVAASASRVKVFYKGPFQTKESLNGTDWVSDPFNILIGEVDPPKSNVERLPATINAGDTGSFLVQLVDVYAQVHNARYCVPGWNNIAKQLVTSTTVNCSESKNQRQFRWNS
eukprot:g66335.t1